MTIKCGNFDTQPRAILAHASTPIDAIPNISRHTGTANLFVKRDDCTGLGMGGNSSFIGVPPLSKKQMQFLLAVQCSQIMFERQRRLHARWISIYN